MKCSECETELTGGLDTYGPQNYPLCRTCFLSGKMPGDERAKKIIEIEQEILVLDADIAQLEDEIDDLRRGRRQLLSEKDQLEHSRQSQETQAMHGWNAAVLI